jgi:hypothetical protein
MPGASPGGQRLREERASPTGLVGREAHGFLPRAGWMGLRSVGLASKLSPFLSCFLKHPNTNTQKNIYNYLLFIITSFVKYF